MEQKELDGIKVSNILYEELRNYIGNKKKPVIIDISIGENFGGLMYSKMKQKKINKETGIDFKSIHFENIEYKELIEYIHSLNNDENINGIMIQLPLPDYLKKYEREILNTIDNRKDIDGLTTNSLGCLNSEMDTFIPCTALGIETLLKSYNICLEGKTVAIINRSNIVGKPLMHLMLRNNATPIICHSKTNNLKQITSKCDIIVVAMNKKEYITREYVKDNAIVIDVGVHKNEEGKTVGDINYKDIFDKASLISPPTGSVGPMTICMLAYNATKSVYGKDIDTLLENGIEKVKKFISV